MAKRTFEEWLVAVDAAIERRSGVSREDLPNDCDYWSWWADGIAPNVAARTALAEAAMA